MNLVRHSTGYRLHHFDSGRPDIFQSCDLRRKTAENHRTALVPYWRDSLVGLARCPCSETNPTSRWCRSRPPSRRRVAVLGPSRQPKHSSSQTDCNTGPQLEGNALYNMSLTVRIELALWTANYSLSEQCIFAIFRVHCMRNDRNSSIYFIN
jgi:hypothetical protein